MLTRQSKMLSHSSGFCSTFGLVKLMQFGVPALKFSASPCRFLYTKEALGLIGYEKTRERTSTQLGSMKDRFKTRMEQYLTADSKSLIFTEDLKNMLYLADNDADLNMVERMMKKFVKQNEQLRFGSFVFGPVVMRMLSFLDKPDAAMKLIQDPELASFFDQLTSYQVLMDLLYEKKRYADVLKLYNILSDRPFFAGRFPKETLVLAIASLHKIGTPEAYAQSKELIKKVIDANAPVMRKAVSYAADLALKNNDAAGCLETLSIANNQIYVSIRNLKILALLKMDRLEDVLPILRSVLEQDVAYGFKRTQASFFSDVIAQVKVALEKKGDKELQHEFDKVFTSLDSGNHLDQAGSTLSEFLDKEIEDSKPRDGTSAFGSGGQTFRQREDSGGLRQPRYADDSSQGGGSRYGQGYNRPRPSFGQDTASLQGRTDMGEGSGFGNRQPGSFQQRGFQPRNQFQPRGYGSEPRQQFGSDAGGGYNSNEEAGYKPRSTYQRNNRGEESGRYNSNAEAGYKPRTGYQRNAAGQARQGLQDLDD